MNEPDIETVQLYFEAALGVPRDQRSAFLTKLSDMDVTLRDEVEALLLADENNPIQDAIKLPSHDTSKSQGILPGSEIGPHHVLGQIGKGGMGVIYKALDTRLNRHVALKFLPSSMNADTLVRERFLAEARAASQLDHPNICVIHDVGETADGQIFITMPCYEGETLDQRIGRGPVSESAAIEIAIQVCNGLATAHAQNIVHRDIKPSNIMLTREGYIKILDFGIAKLQDVNSSNSGISTGTIPYMSPEQLRSETTDARTDVWSLGTVLFEMLTAKKAFPHKTLGAIIQAVLNDNYEPLASLDVAITDSLEHVLKLSLERDLGKRFGDISAMRQTLISAKSDTQLSDTNKVTSSARLNRKTKSRSYEWDDSILQKVAAILTPTLGPIAPILIQRMAKTASNMNELCERLGEYLPDNTHRKQFYQQMETQVAAVTIPPSPHALRTDGSLTGIDLNTSQLATIENALTPYLGPITPTMIKRLAANASSLQHLFETLSDHLHNETEKETFLQQVSGLLHN